MTSVEYLDLLMAGRPTRDRPPGHLVMSFVKQFCCVQTGRPYGRYSQDFRVLTQCQLELQEEYPVDAFNVMGYPYREAGDCGLHVEFPEDAQPIARGPLIRDRDGLAALRWPEPRNGRLMADRISAIAAFKEKAPDVVAMGACEAPFALATTFLGIETAMLCLYDDPGFLHDVMDFIVPNAIRFARAQVEAGAELIFMGDAIASQVGPELYAEHVLEYETAVVAAIQEMGAPVRLHICGDITPLIDHVARTGARMIDIDYAVDLRLACERLARLSPDSYAVGNVNPVTVLLQGTPDDVRAACRDCEQQASGFESFILSPGCEVPPATPVENYAAMLEFGWRARAGESSRRTRT